MQYVLFVEDNPAQQNIFVRVFGDIRPNFDVVVVDDGEKAPYDLLCRCVQQDRRETSPAFILLDLNLAGISGKVLIQRFRDERGLVHLPVVLLSTLQSERDVWECDQLGCWASIRTTGGKPVSNKKEWLYVGTLST